MSNALIDAAVKFLHENSGTGSVKDHLMIGGDQGDDHVVHIHDTPHTDENATRVDKRIAYHMHKMYPKHYKSEQHARDKHFEATEHIDDYHALVSKHDASQKGLKHSHYKTLEDYAKHEAKTTHKYLKSQKDED